MNSPTSSTAIRHDIDGLRAIAVIIVILYHCGVGDLGGGFVGVDVFFVISGYLIIPQIVRLMQEGRFSFADFMGRRVRRLVPALVPVLLYALVAGLVLLGSGALEDFLSSLAGAAAFASNYVFLGQSGYFERTTDTTLLLHTWSLGVEFQFYLIAPLFLMLVSHRATLALGGLIAASLALAIYLVGQSSDWAFYGVGPRLWELAIGGLNGLWQPRFANLGRGGIVMRVIGIALIAYAAHTYKSYLPFPGAAALLPVLGAALIVAAPPVGKDPVYMLLSNRVMQWIGTRSYSIYLWHWPLIVTVALVSPEQNDLKSLSAAALALPLAELSYRFVETPIRRGQFWRPQLATLSLIVLPVLVFGGVFLLGKGSGALTVVRGALPAENVRTINDLGDNARAAYLDKVAQDGTDGRAGVCSLDRHRPVAELRPCITRAAKGQTGGILVLGDSHSLNMFHALRAGLPDVPKVVLFESACGPVDYRRPNGERCFNGLAEELPSIVEELKPNAIVLASHWPPSALAPVQATMDLAKSLGVTPIVIGPAPVFKNSAIGLLHMQGLGGASLDNEARLALRFKFDVPQVNADLADIAAARGIAFVDRYSQICDASSCAAFVPGEGLELMFWDNQHMAIGAMDWYGKVLRDHPAFAAFAK